MSDINSTKKCSGCKTIKPLSLFCKDASKPSGFHSSCKECKKKYDTVYTKTTKRKLSLAAYKKSDAGKLSRVKYQENSPIKIKAKNTVNHEIRTGRITRPDNCEECATTAELQGHHDDYALPLVVRWLCSKCHGDWHAKNGRGLNG